MLIAVYVQQKNTQQIITLTVTYYGDRQAASSLRKGQFHLPAEHKQQIHKLYLGNKCLSEKNAWIITNANEKFIF
jgi:hypothetical protein